MFKELNDNAIGPKWYKKKHSGNKIALSCFWIFAHFDSVLNQCATFIYRKSSFTWPIFEINRKYTFEKHLFHQTYLSTSSIFQKIPFFWFGNLETTFLEYLLNTENVCISKKFDDNFFDLMGIFAIFFSFLASWLTSFEVWWDPKG